MGNGQVEPPPGVREEWEFWTDLTLEMRQAAVRRYRGVNGFIKASRRSARPFHRSRGLKDSPRTGSTGC